jgi:hypothetical protein
MRRRIRLAAALPFHRHSLPQLAVDAGLVALAYYLAYQLRFDGDVPALYSDLFERTIGFVIVGSPFVFALFGLYRHWMRYSTQRDYLRIAQACVVATLSLMAYVAIVQPRLRFDGADSRFEGLPVPAGVVALYGLLMLVFVGGSRFVVHALYERPLSGFRARRDARSVLIVGAGDGGRLLLREIMRNPQLGFRPVGFVDDDPRKQRARIDRGLSVLGTTEELPRVLEDVEPDEVLIAIPSAPGTMRARVVAACRERGVPVRTMPTVFELLQDGGRVLRQVRAVEVEDMLGREPVRMDIDRVGGYLTGRIVLVTGAGGSIGAELCRQIARVGPSKLILLDHAEDNLFRIRRELVEDRHVLNTAAVLADCKEGERMREVFAEHRPAVVFHAAAYKHVHLMEENPVEAVRNNALATPDVPGGRRGRRDGVRARLDRQGRCAEDRDGRVEGARRVGDRGRRPALPGHGLLRRAVRQRARLVRVRRADLPPPDRRGRAGHGHAPGHDPLFHDDPGGRPAGHPRGLARPGRRGVRAGDGRAGEDHGPRARHDPALRPRARSRHRDRGDRAAPGREAPRGAVQPV